MLHAVCSICYPSQFGVITCQSEDTAITLLIIQDGSRNTLGVWHSKVAEFMALAAVLSFTTAGLTAAHQFSVESSVSELQIQYIYNTQWMHGTEIQHCPSCVQSRSWSSMHG